jgi:hypothetical protein
LLSVNEFLYGKNKEDRKKAYNDNEVWNVYWMCRYFGMWKVYGMWDVEGL